MKTMVSMINKYALSFTLAALMIGAATGIRSVAQQANPASNTKPTNEMARYVEAVREGLVSGTGATNLTDVEVRRLMNESIKTNLAAQLWFRQAMLGTGSGCGVKMAEELRVLERLRQGRTNDAIRILEDALDSSIVVLADHLRVCDEIKGFKPTPQSRTTLQWAKEYRLKFPYKSGNSAMDDRVKHNLSYLDQK
jgi:hypothetical protein